jgi:protein SCO1
MTTIRLLLCWQMLLLMALVGCTAVSAQNDDTVVVSDGWVRPAQTMSAAYLQIHNNGRFPVNLVSIETTAAASAELHQTEIEGDLMRMRPVAAIPIPAGETVRLEPASWHIMLVGLTAPLVEGQLIPLTLTFDNNIQLETSLKVSSTSVNQADALTAQMETAVASGINLGQIVTPPVAVQNFYLPGSHANINQFSDLDGQWRVIFFGYRHCPDFCPLTLVDYKQTKTLLGEAAANVTFIFISIDPVRDTPDAIQAYLANFDSDFVGFSADDATLNQIQPDYGFYYERRLDSGSQAMYTIDHSTRSYLVDPNGLLRASFAYDTDPKIIASALQWYIAHEANNNKQVILHK